jgi:hypothetical protein
MPSLTPPELVVSETRAASMAEFAIRGEMRAPLDRALSQIIENRKVETRNSLIFQQPIFGFYLQKATLRQSLLFVLSREDVSLMSGIRPSFRTLPIMWGNNA